MADGVVPASVLVPTTDIYHIEQLDIQTPGLKEFLVLLTNNQNIMALAVNMKDTGYYSYTEFANGQYFPPPFNPATPYNNVQDPNPDYRILINMCPAGAPSLANAGTITVPHNIPFINNTWQVTRCYGAATAPNLAPNAPNFKPLPYASAADKAHDIELWWDNTNVYIRNVADYTAFTRVWVILEYIKQPSQ